VSGRAQELVLGVNVVRAVNLVRAVTAVVVVIAVSPTEGRSKSSL